ncbi:AfsR/SARP family transcriptional regulator [Virgisporangium ochraceum]|uniref:SARP family transcriptional regulator n=1 Tax=Virgisporangium ochraceum TaxID=65505 RepID=A0A8J3ZXE9_9ACTN|nr:AfsR/SARP family transcriptional regulator [Virgisporangium ochraceum]GIJ71834.1 SARP family transcriptional regulator [Virgisporangium ochraceum]
MSEPGELGFALLGPLSVTVDGAPLPVGGPRTQALLAALLLERGSVLTIDRLVGTIWGDAAPASARVQVQNRVATLRRLLPGPLGVIETHGGGYRIPAGTGRLDVDRFERTVRESEELVAAGDEPGAAARLTAALALWRGPALDGLDSPALAVVARKLDERRTAIQVRWAELEIRLGRARAVVGELTELVARHPWHEQLVGQLMTALYLADRRREALLAYDQVKERLADELGLDPGPTLVRLRERILREDPDLLGADDPEPPAGPPATGRAADEQPVPRQVPGDVPLFVGRAALLDELDTLLDGAGGNGTIAAIDGPAGIGKTTLAVHWAHRVAGRFPDGQLYLNLRGFDPGQPVLSGAEALRALLESMRVPVPRIPVGLDARIGLYRSVMAGRRMLVVLDNVRDADHVRPLLPASPGCVAVVTSRNRLYGLVAKEGARLFALDALPATDARRLFTGRVGADRVRAEPRAAEAIVARCAGLPLALAVVAARVVTRNGFPLAALAEQLDDTTPGGSASGGSARLDAFGFGGPDTDVRAAFSWSYRALPPGAARLFRMLALHPGPDFSAAAAASLAGVDVPTATALLAELTCATMVTEPVLGRFAVHDLLRDYGRELAATHDPDGDRRPAVERLLDHYLHGAYAAAVALNPYRDPIAIHPPLAGAVPATVDFYVERPALLAAIRVAADHGFDRHAWQLAWTVADHLDRQGHWPELAAAHETAVAAAARSGDPVGLAHAYIGAARAQTRTGRYPDAEESLTRALRLFSDLGDDAGQAAVHRVLGGVCDLRGDDAEALRHDELALELYRRAGRRAGQASVLNSIGWSRLKIGDHEQALAYCQQSVTLHRAIGNRHGQASALDSLGYVYHHIGDQGRAMQCYERASTMFNDVGDRYHEAYTLVHLGDARHASADGSAVDAWRAALVILDELDHPDAASVRAKLPREASPA